MGWSDAFDAPAATGARWGAACAGPARVGRPMDGITRQADVRFRYSVIGWCRKGVFGWWCAAPAESSSAAHEVHFISDQALEADLRCAVSDVCRRSRAYVQK